MTLDRPRSLWRSFQGLPVRQSQTDAVPGGRAVRRRVVHPLMAAGGLLGMLLPGVLVAPTAAGALGLNLLPSTTTVTATPSTAAAGTLVTITATVVVDGLPGLLITPSGPVKFTATNGGSTTSIGTGAIEGCLLVTCTTTETDPNLPAGITTITATFGGDLLAQASSGSTTVTLNNPVSYTKVTCSAGSGECDAGLIQPLQAGSDTELQVVAENSQTTNTVEEALQAGGTLSCQGDTDATLGDLAYFGETASGAQMGVSYVGLDDVGTQMAANAEAHPEYAGCLASPTEFQGYVGGQLEAAPSVNGVYEAQVPACNASQTLPCYVDAGSSFGAGTDTYDLAVPAGSQYEFIG